MFTNVSSKVLLGTLLVALLATNVHAADTAVAIVQALNSAWLNGVPVPRVSAIFPGDIIQTKAELADIDAFGSKVLVLSDSLVTYRDNSVELQRGGVSVQTSKLLATQFAGFTIRPASATWTRFQVLGGDETVHIAAMKGDLILADENGTTTLSSGQEITREVPQRKWKKRSAGAFPAAQKSILERKAALYVAGATIGGITTWVLLQQEDPISPDTP